MAQDTATLRQRAAHLHTEHEEFVLEITERLEQSGLLELILFGQLHVTVTNGVVQELTIAPTYKPNRKKPIGGLKVTT